MEFIKKKYKVLSGYSDHTLPKDMFNLVAATTLGAKIIEKHFTLDKKLKGNDHYHSIDKKDLIKISKDLKRLKEVLGEVIEKKALPSEKKSRKNARRSIVVNKNLNKWEIYLGVPVKKIGDRSKKIIDLSKKYLYEKKV